MNNRYYQSIETILECINNIDSYTGKRKSFAKYEANNLVQDAVERNLEIIGEAMKRILELKPDVNITDTRKIIGTRNIISHGYDIIQNEDIWKIIINHLPILKQEVGNLLDDKID